jgi:hypothetical protein
MLGSLLPAGVTLTPRCSGSIPGNSVESLTLMPTSIWRPRQGVLSNPAADTLSARIGGQSVVDVRRRDRSVPKSYA